ncbi:nucleoside hydrolase [Shewanella sp. NFH-SH190041]|uniref:nucleoside hydrolase n=1 Tax=Shewanella sp. NFH-SH190041 TaxID=2950245 RepID=UPI0021C2620B|nr:nucleoside hydrolase [Shewanella sp. NFH-SH190041]BDM63382.1 nucleoside hydrolase [Shewanella sp. NFH-SH190041]
MHNKIILDTDPGIDDAMAILFAQAHPQIELMGITTVYGNATVENATRNAQYLKARFAGDYPIAMGTDRPLVKPGNGPTVIVHGESGFGDLQIPPQTDIPIDPRPAHQFIIDMVKAHPGEITLVAVGPLTNLALALQTEPQITQWVKQVVIMGGAFGEHGHRGNVTPVAEANIHDDPHAADRVFTANWPVVIIGLDVTQQSFFSGHYLDNLRDTAGEAGRFIYDISRYYLRFYAEKLGLDGCHVHDPSAIAYVINPHLFTLRQGPVRVVLQGCAEGMTLQKFDSHNYPNNSWDTPAQQVAIKVDNHALLQLYRETIEAFGHHLASSKSRPN